MKNRITKFVMKIVIVFVTLTSVNLYAAAKTWNGSVSTDWNTADNWTVSGVPGSGDDVTIPTSPTGGRMPTISSGTFATKKLTIQSGATLTQNGGTLTPTDLISITGSFSQSAGTFTTTKDLTVNAGGSVSIGGSFSGANVDVNSTGAVSVSGTFTTNDNKITIDGGTFTQTGGTVSTRDMELTNSGTYNQSGGEFQIVHDLKVPVGTTFNGTGGTVRFTGAAGAGAVYSGNVQFNNLIVDAGADYNLEDGDMFKISGNYTNNNSTLKDEKGTLKFNGTSSQTFYSASPNNIAGNIIVSNSVGVTLLSELKAKISFTLESGGHVIKNGFGIYVNGVEYTGPTPVELVSFNAKVKNNVVLLDWKTATEVNNYGFEIERSLTPTPSQREGALTWEKIGFVNGHGNSNSPKEYSYEDSKLSNNFYQYRLKQVDNDGTFSYSNSVSVSVDEIPSSFVLHQNYPNPFNPTTAIRYAIAEESFVTIKVYNIIGSEIATLINAKLSAGNHEIKFDASSLSSGAYIYKIKAGRFSETRKMILSK